MASLFFDNEEKKYLKQAIDKLEKENGTVIYSKDCENVYSNSCDRWDCFVSCDCANSWK